MWVGYDLCLSAYRGSYMLSSMNHLVLDLSNPDIAKALKGCGSGDHVEFTVGGTLAVNGKAATVNLDSVKYTAAPGATDDEEAEGESKPMPAAKASKPPKPKMASAVSEYAPGQ